MNWSDKNKKKSNYCHPTKHTFNRLTDLSYDDVPTKHTFNRLTDLNYDDVE